MSDRMLFIIYIMSWKWSKWAPYSNVKLANKEGRNSESSVFVAQLVDQCFSLHNVPAAAQMVHLQYVYSNSQVLKPK